MKHIEIILFTLLLTASLPAQVPVVIPFDNPQPDPGGSCNVPFAESGIDMVMLEVSGICSYFFGGGDLGLAPSKLSADLSTLTNITTIEVDVTDFCGVGCSEVEVLNAGSQVAVSGNTAVGSLQTLILDVTGLAVDELTLVSFEGFFHEVRIYQASGCQPPGGLTATAGITSAAISWTAVSSATEYVFRYREEGTLPWMTIITAGNGLTLTGLIANTNYEYQVQSSCEDDQSSFSGIADFTTLSPSGCIDSDGDGVCDFADECPGFDDNIDRDDNGVPDYCDFCDFDRVMAEPHLPGDAITYETMISVTSTHPINSGADIVFKAGEFVLLEAGFQVVLGAEFEVIMEPCDLPTR